MFLIVDLKGREVAFGPSGGWGIVLHTESHAPYLHDKSRSQGEPQALGSGVLFFFFFPFILFFTNIFLIRGEREKKILFSLTHSLQTG